MKEMIKNSLILFAITLVAGFILGTVYDITKEPRAKQQVLATQRAYKEVFADGDKFEDADYKKDDLNKFIKENGISANEAEIETIVKAIDKSGKDIGYVFTIISKEGYGGDIKFTLGVDMEGSISGMSILSINETAGLGMQANTDGFKNQFKGINADKITFSKTGKSADNEIDAISGATITTTTMVKGVNAGLFAFSYLTGGAANE